MKGSSFEFWWKCLCYFANMLRCNGVIAFMKVMRIQDTWSTVSDYTIQVKCHNTTALLPTQAIILIFNSLQHKTYIYIITFFGCVLHVCFWCIHISYIFICTLQDKQLFSCKIKRINSFSFSTVLVNKGNLYSVIVGLKQMHLYKLPH